MAAGILKEGGVDILYNNAAIMSAWTGNISEQDMENWSRVFRINVFAPMRLTTLLLEDMRTRGWGRIVNVTSGIDKTWQLAAYGASKWRWTNGPTISGVTLKVRG